MENTKNPENIEILQKKLEELVGVFNNQMDYFSKLRRILKDHLNKEYGGIENTLGWRALDRILNPEEMKAVYSSDSVVSALVQNPLRNPFESYGLNKNAEKDLQFLIAKYEGESGLIKEYGQKNEVLQSILKKLGVDLDSIADQINNKVGKVLDNDK